VLGKGDHGVHKGTIDVFVDIDTFGGDADLPGVEERAECNLRCSLCDIDIRKDDAGVITTELQALVRRDGKKGLSWALTSNVTRFRVSAAACMIFLPVAMDPVKEILWMSG
jgi:hypothetical protein